MRDLMNLFELAPYRDNDVLKNFVKGPADDIFMKHFLTYLKDAGYKPLGSGAFGSVFTHPNINYAVKLIKNDPAYMRFVKYALAHQQDPHLPKFRGKFMKIDALHFCVRMEMLEPIINARAVSDYINYYLRDPDILADEPYDSSVEGTQNFFKANTGLARTLDELTDINTDVFDLHADNIMQRKDGTIVITDPFYG